MRLNQDCVLVGKKLTLVPYCKHHVLKYHNWMSDQELQELTASEPLTLEEEYEMQRSWIDDEEKLTFIALSGTSAAVSKEEEISRMVGDINLFFISSPEVAEINIMVAEKNYKNLGYGTEMLQLMMCYAKQYLNISKFSAKISNSNIGSIKFFQKQGFHKISSCPIFHEEHYELPVDSPHLALMENNLVKLSYTFSE